MNRQLAQAMISHNLYQNTLFFKHQNQLRPTSVLSLTGGANLAVIGLLYEGYNSPTFSIKN